MDRDLFNEYLIKYFTLSEIDKILDCIIHCENIGGIILQYHNETALIYDTYNDLFVSWYKITHIGRSIKTNLNENNISTFFKDLKYLVFD